MNIEEREYSTDQFKGYLIQNTEEVFCDDNRKKWLKIYSLLVGDEPWKNNLFKDDELKKLGDIYKITPKLKTATKSEFDMSEDIDSIDIAPSDDDDEEVYFVEEYCPGLLLFYTSANDEHYRKTLGDRVKKTIGTTRMWLKPEHFQTLWKGIIKDTGGYVYRFTSRRGLIDDTPSKIRPNYRRRFSYTGDDASQTIEEIEEMYGVTPESIYLQANENLKMHITNDGLFSAQDASTEALNYFFKYLDLMKEEILTLRRITKSLRYNVIPGRENLQFASIDAGEISLNNEINADQIGSLINEMNNFSFLDKSIQVGSLNFTSTVVDDLKGCVFDVCASERKISIVPKYRVTFESFIDFYRGIVESIDENAKLTLVTQS
jgi:hypothetical protein